VAFNWTLQVNVKRNARTYKILRGRGNGLRVLRLEEFDPHTKSKRLVSILWVHPRGLALDGRE